MLWSVSPCVSCRCSKLHQSDDISAQDTVAVQYMLHRGSGGRDVQHGVVGSLNAGRRADFRQSMKRITAPVLRLLQHHLILRISSTGIQAALCLYARFSAPPWISTSRSWLQMRESSSPGLCRYESGSLVGYQGAGCGCRPVSHQTAGMQREQGPRCFMCSN